MGAWHLFDEGSPGPVSATLRLKRAELELRRDLGPVLGAEGITLEHWQVLAALAEREGQTMTELAASAVLPAASLTRHVDRLIERALIIRRVDAGDRRRAVVALSALGRQLAARLRELERRSVLRTGEPADRLGDGGEPLGARADATVPAGA
jgi:DNA-binding MarR family transcriptional regulator